MYTVQHAIQAGKCDCRIYMLKLDHNRAYDRVRSEWLLDGLVAYGFGPRFINYIREFFKHPTLRQSVEGHMIDPVRLDCGLPQGDPMSDLLYALSLQPMRCYASGRGSLRRCAFVAAAHALSLI
ncbi:hypothetical protein PaG_04796 [Moesziomyces aphidis]|uniref:Reverse transcriptase domain-containing protein n=1 Tax=Moesziomyces aphidis TaxID=84754 RepID=W3VGU9_MOEAP|nr:hypothetical protein PaG_04796 [Moesziomyces aphidis]